MRSSARRSASTSGAFAARRRELPDRRQASSTHAHAALGLAHRRRAPWIAGIRAGSAGLRGTGGNLAAGEDEPASFESHIKPLFPPVDKQSMNLAFDLWSYEASADTPLPSSPRCVVGPRPATAAGRPRRPMPSSGGSRPARRAERKGLPPGRASRCRTRCVAVSALQAICQQVGVID
jgi:hypothetical protein